MQGRRPRSEPKANVGGPLQGKAEGRAVVSATAFSERGSRTLGRLRSPFLPKAPKAEGRGRRKAGPCKGLAGIGWSRPYATYVASTHRSASVTGAALYFASAPLAASGTPFPFRIRANVSDEQKAQLEALGCL